MVTFGPDGITAHPDHIRVGEAATEAFHRLRAKDADGFRRLLYACLPQSMIVRANEMLVASGEEPFDATRIYHPRGVPDETIGVRVDCSAVWQRKRDAVKAHLTQADDSALPPDLDPVVYSTETFVQAWPERDPGTPVLATCSRGSEARVRAEGTGGAGLVASVR